MATVSETELEQKTSEYANFVREHFLATGSTSYSTKFIRVLIDGDVVILEYEGK